MTQPMNAAASPDPGLYRALAGRTVLQVVSELAGTEGVENDVADVASALVAAGARALVAGPAGPLVGELQARGAEWLPLPSGRTNIARTLGNVPRLRCIIRAEKVALVHVRARAPAWSAYLASRFLGVPLMTTHSGPYAGNGLTARLYNGIMARGDIVLVSSQFTADLVARRHKRARGRILLVPRGIDLDACDPAAVPPLRIAAQRAEWDAEPEERIVLLPARFKPWKGQAVLVEAVQRLGEAAPVRLVLAGEARPGDAYLRRLARRIEADGLAERVSAAEAPQDMAAALMAADVVVLPSTEPEAFARTALQALALGRPLVVSAIGAQQEVIRLPPAMRTGWLVPPGDADALAAALAEALALDDAGREALAGEARRQVDLRFSRRREVAATLGAYARAIGSAVRAPGDVQGNVQPGAPTTAGPDAG
ncbi:MAG TPA: glycosyltransferase [Xanthobacteraceae bacterium]|nr:glycosyltransferase [Xanthobacteraceae bacterium]